MFLIVKLAFLICEVLMNRYIAFLKAFERNSFSDAARDLGYTQSAVSQMIKSLEAELDRKSTRLNSSHTRPSRMPSSA